MSNVLYCIKEMAIMFALVSMVMAAAVGGACLLLHTLQTRQQGEVRPATQCAFTVSGVLGCLRATTGQTTEAEQYNNGT